MDTAKDQLKKFLTKIHPFTEIELEQFSEKWQLFFAKRKEILTRSGETEKYLYFVLEGVQKVFYTDEMGREATLVFTYGSSFGGVIDSMINGSLSKYNYEALTNSSFLRIPFAEIEILEQQVPAISQVIRKGLSGALSGVLERMVEIQCYSAEERFRNLLRRSPHILQLVSHKYLANYLGMDATNFS